MFLSLAIILLSGLLAGWLCRKLRLPPLLGMLLVGILIGPYALDVIAPAILNISAELRKLALIIILARAGLRLKIDDLKKIGRPALLLCFVPACFEILGMVLFAPPLLGISVLDALVLGSVIGAVSPAVIVPKMLKLMENGIGTKKGIPQMILAGASVDDIFVIVLFSAFTKLADTGEFSPLVLFKIPASILLGAGAGLLCGYLLGKCFQRLHVRDTVKIILLLCFSFLGIALEDNVPLLPFSSFIAVMGIGIALQSVRPDAAERLSARYNKLWVVAEIVLFVLVGATVNLEYAAEAGGKTVLLLFAVLAFRMLGVFLCLLRTKFNRRERLFCAVAYLPKATVQAAIGGIPLAMGLACGDLVLTAAVLSILITAPLGAFLIDLLQERLLTE